MADSKIKQIISPIIGDEEKYEELRRNLDYIEREVNNLADKNPDDLDAAVDRALELIARKSSSVFIDSHSSIERDIRKNLS